MLGSHDSHADQVHAHVRHAAALISESTESTKHVSP